MEKIFFYIFRTFQTKLSFTRGIRFINFQQQSKESFIKAATNTYEPEAKITRKIFLIYAAARGNVYSRGEGDTHKFAMAVHLS